MTKNDMYILSAIKRIGATNSLNSAPISTILKNVKISESTIRISIRKLIKNGLVEKGYMQKNANTYYITQEGINLIEDISKQVKTKED